MLIVMLIVQKYGGTSVGSFDRIRNVANRIKALLEEGHSVAVVVSAMGGVTDKLIAMAQEVCDDPEPEDAAYHARKCKVFCRMNEDQRAYRSMMAEVE